MNKIPRTLALAAALLAAAGGAALAAPVATAAASTPAAPAPHLVQGFRSAHFGMTEAEVKAAIAHDFAPDGAALGEFDNPTEMTHAPTLRLAALAPAPGPATVTYIFGASGKRLIHVNVVWKTGDTPSDDERARISTAGAQLASYFHDLAWRAGSTATNVAPDGSSAVVFAGVDPRDEAVEVRLSGVAIERRGKPVTTPTGPAVLRVAYYATTGKADTSVAVKVGSF